MEKQELLQKYINEEDKFLVSKILDKIKAANTKNYLAYTDFLNMREQKIAEEVMKIQKINNYFFYGGNFDMERKILVIYPDKLTEEICIEQAKKQLSIIRITLPKANSIELSHRDYLGLIMKLGVKREKLGDILVFENGADIIVEKEIAKFLLEEMPRFTRFHKAQIEEHEIDELRQANLNLEELTVIVPSLRLDSMVSELAKCSRTKASEIIEQERVFINFEICTKASKLLNVADIVTIRGKGRFKIEEQLGLTKKDNIIVKVLKTV